MAAKIDKKRMDSLINISKTVCNDFVSKVRDI